MDLKESSSSPRLQLVMSSQSADRMDELKKLTEAASYGELVRRALQFLDRLQEHSFTIQKDDIVEESKRRNTRIQVIISQKTKERLDKLRGMHEPEMSYSDVIIIALNSYAKAVDRSVNGKSINLNRGDEIIEYDLSLAF